LVATIAAALAEQPDSRAAFFGSVVDLDPASYPTFVGIVRRMRQLGTPVTGRETRPLVSHLVSVRQFGWARIIWQSTHPELIGNGEFEARRSSSGLAPDEWFVLGGLQPRAVIEAPPLPRSGLALHIQAGAGVQSVIQQTLLLPPGRYQLSDVLLAPRGFAGNAQWRILCLPLRKSQTLGRPDSNGTGNWMQRSFSVDVPKEDCPVQQLSLKIQNVLSRETDLWLDGVQVRSLDR
jgi:hypothetical protein